MAASHTPLPVIGVPVKATHLDGKDSLLSIVQMPVSFSLLLFLFIVPLETKEDSSAEYPSQLLASIILQMRHYLPFAS
jgi:phosphoribosylcarboxyaminoimidazole (NCAIR) mutase